MTKTDSKKKPEPPSLFDNLDLFAQLPEENPAAERETEETKPSAPPPPQAPKPAASNPSDPPPPSPPKP